MQVNHYLALKKFFFFYTSINLQRARLSTMKQYFFNLALVIILEKLLTIQMQF